MGALSTYITQTRRLLHDSNADFWTDAELTDYINEARNRVVSDTGCLRTLQTSTLVAGQESYAFSTLPQANQTIDCINLTVIWGATRVPLQYYVYTDFNANFRTLVNFQQLPYAYTLYDQQTVMVAPIPDQAYPVEFDTVILPNALQSDTSIEQILYPFTMPISFYAAYLAKMEFQAFTEANNFETMYNNKVQEVLMSTHNRRIFGP